MKRSIPIAWVLILAACPPPTTPATTPAATPAAKTSTAGVGQNKTGISQDPCPGAEPCTCRGALAFGIPAIQKLGLSEEALAAGTPCLIGDLDGNGFSDLVFVEPSYGKVEGGARQVVNASVLYFDHVGLTMIQEVPKKVALLSLEPAATGMKLVAGSSEHRLVFELVEGRLVGKKP
jgi:hypothetical protein